MIRRREIAHVFRGNFSQLDDRVDDRLEPGMSVHHRAEHNVFREFLGFRLNHQNRVNRSGDNEIEGRIRHFRNGRVQAEFAVDIADARAAHRAHERNA